jgi:hypothetical protein
MIFKRATVLLEQRLADFGFRIVNKDLFLF